jgi:hypothetical protein
MSYDYFLSYSQLMIRWGFCTVWSSSSPTYPSHCGQGNSHIQVAKWSKNDDDKYMSTYWRLSFKDHRCHPWRAAEEGRTFSAYLITFFFCKDVRCSLSWDFTNTKLCLMSVNNSFNHIYWNSGFQMSSFSSLHSHHTCPSMPTQSPPSCPQLSWLGSWLSGKRWKGRCNPVNSRIDYWIDV